MAETEYSTTTHLSVQTIWDFVQDMDNWARFVTGYQNHEKRSETDSVWTLKGDVGMLSRTLNFEVAIVEWSGPERVGFTLRGVNEPMEGHGLFWLESVKATGANDETASAPRRGVFARALERLLRLLSRRFRRPRPRADRTGAVAASRMRFQLRIDPGGPMGPMVDALIQPVMTVAAEDLAGGIIAHLERGGGDEAAAS